ncbi:MAG: 2-C-methyl-D-erythritol 2,4-cyclodiphosphate synthase [Clostridia bacterium]|nr:2-C-methyl-D-erythritol 2,4-cyclodiphosphate synthase [Clostridia bacterium]
MKTSVIITCAGKGERAGFNKNKLLVKVDGVTTVERVFKVFKNCDKIDQIILTAHKNDYDEIKNIVGDSAEVVIGGETRTDSVKNALQKVTGEIVLIHDGARPYLSIDLIYKCIESVKNFGSGIACINCKDSVCKTKDGTIIDYVDRNTLSLIQTPQAFYTKDIAHAYELASEEIFTDDSQVYKKYIGEPKVVDGEQSNVKLTFKEDFISTKDIRYGVGFDCHQLVENRKLILGGIEIPHDKGLLGHSDADVLTHAIMDAILSSLSLRDIGYHFPPTDEKYKDANSMKLLDHVLDLIYNNGYKVKTVSAVIMAEKPKLLKHIPAITKNLANALNVKEKDVGITATTLEGLGFVGREEGICVHANAILENV